MTRVIATLLSVLLATILASASASSPPPSRGLEAMGAAACAETEAFCEKTILRALREDAKLRAFLEDVRQRAMYHSPGDLAGYAHAVPNPTSLRFPEQLALGCCLAAGECKTDLQYAAPADGPEETEEEEAEAIARGEADARRAAGEILLAAASHEDAGKMPAVQLLGANAHVCAPPAGESRCGAKLVDAYRRAGNAGYEVGNLRAGEALLARFSGSLIADETLGCPRADARNEAGDFADAATARALFKQLLASNEHDKRASKRLKELREAEDRVASGDGPSGKPDLAYAAADALVNAVLKGVFVIVVVVVPSFLARNTRFARAVRDVAWRYSGCAMIARQFRRELEFFRFAKPRVVNGGRAAARVERRQSAKKTAKAVMKEVMKAEAKKSL
jgi:hypothetical protein